MIFMLSNHLLQVLYQTQKQISTLLCMRITHSPYMYYITAHSIQSSLQLCHYGVMVIWEAEADSLQEWHELYLLRVLNNN